MTQEQEKELYDFEARVRQLMAAYRDEQRKSAALAEKLQLCQQELADAKQSLDAVQGDYETLRSARIIEVSGTDVKETRAKVAHLIREVDKCIALLDV